ncbi:MAG TPA: UDP-3-O-(3-hydroxymyristoyl)glucosamine N-acyltransferase [Ohtaekwangia sp.]|uniref:UDP-3-O-(3-hydroxymyristoyl)glucosamine N-acyltransferase n=1 Tax=Ohtaekwangia sp. TaxID=2066019 RepID=UPI002F937C2F
METSLKEIIREFPVIEVIGNTTRTIRNIVRATDNDFHDDDIVWISDKNIDLVKSVGRGCIICSQLVSRNSLFDECTYLIVNNPRLYFLNIVKHFFVESEAPEISVHSVIHPTVKIGVDVTIRAGVVIEKDCVIGNYTSIDSNTVIKKRTIIGNNVKIGANNTIGGEGFGYEKNEAGQYEFIPHIGNVLIEDNVEIGNNTAIDRAVLGSTILRKNSKIDNLVHIAHGVDVGENSMVIANSMVAGSVSLGKNVWVAPSASVLNKLVVGDDSIIGMGAVVLKNVAAGQTVVGNPAKDLQSLKPK